MLYLWPSEILLRCFEGKNSCSTKSSIINLSKKRLGRELTPSHLYPKVCGSTLGRTLFFQYVCNWKKISKSRIVGLSVCSGRRTWNFLNHFFFAQPLSAQRLGLIATSLIFLCVLDKFLCSWKCKCCSFESQVGLKTKDLSWNHFFKTCVYSKTIGFVSSSCVVFGC